MNCKVINKEHFESLVPKILVGYLISYAVKLAND